MSVSVDLHTIARMLNRPDTYSREEVLKMVELIREKAEERGV